MIPRGTTPTIRFAFNVIDVATIVVCYLTIQQGDLTIEKDLSEATIGGGGYLEWSLTQEETLALGDDNIDIQIRYRLGDGRALQSKIYTVHPSMILKEGVI